MAGVSRMKSTLFAVGCMALLARRWLEHFNADMWINADTRPYRDNALLLKRDVSVRSGNLQALPAIRVLHIFHPRRIFNPCAKHRLLDSIPENINIHGRNIMEERDIKPQPIFFNIKGKIGLIFVLFRQDSEELDKFVFVPFSHTIREAG